MSWSDMLTTLAAVVAIALLIREIQRQRRRLRAFRRLVRILESTRTQLMGRRGTDDLVAVVDTLLALVPSRDRWQ